MKMYNVIDLNERNAALELINHTLESLKAMFKPDEQELPEEYTKWLEIKDIDDLEEYLLNEYDGMNVPYKFKESEVDMAAFSCQTVSLVDAYGESPIFVDIDSAKEYYKAKTRLTYQDYEEFGMCGMKTKTEIEECIKIEEEFLNEIEETKTLEGLMLTLNRFFCGRDFLGIKYDRYYLAFI